MGVEIHKTADVSVRRRLDELIRQRPGETYASVSALIGRNHAYIQQFIKRGQPRRLREEDRRQIAAYFGVDELELGGLPRPSLPGFSECGQNLVFVERLTPAAAGDGYSPTTSSAQPDAGHGYLPFRKSDLERLTATSAERLCVVTMSGDAMYPTIGDGDDLLVDLAQSHPLRDGLYAVRRDGEILVKRISRNPESGEAVLGSDNPFYERWRLAETEQIEVLGRVLWVGRRL